MTELHDTQKSDGTEPASAADWPSERKLRLFACACCRRVMDRLAPPVRRAVRVAERYADGRLELDDLEYAWRRCRRLERRGKPIPLPTPTDGLRYYRDTTQVHRVAAPVFTPFDAATVADDLRPWRGDSGENDEADAAHDHLFRDVLGGPPAPPAASWRTPVVVAAATAIYRGRAFEGLPELAARLEANGCRDSGLLEHFRRRGPHARGCWALDCVLGLG